MSNRWKWEMVGGMQVEEALCQLGDSLSCTRIAEPPVLSRFDERASNHHSRHRLIRNDRNTYSQHIAGIAIAMSAAKGTAKVLQKLEKSVSEGNYYEAHQMYRTVANR